MKKLCKDCINCTKTKSCVLYPKYISLDYTTKDFVPEDGSNEFFISCIAINLDGNCKDHTPVEQEDVNAEVWAPELGNYSEWVTPSNFEV